MLRACVALLLVANLGFYAWTRGWLDAVIGIPAHGGREPERLARQLRPETIRILTPSAAQGAPVPRPSAPAPPAPGAPAAPVSFSGGDGAFACLQAGPYAPPEAARVEAQLRASLAGLAPGSLVNAKVETQGTWLIYMGRFANREALAKKQDDLRRIPSLVYEEVRELPQLEPGLVLGRHASRAAAEASLAKLAERGVRSARVLALSAPASMYNLRFPHADEALRAQLHKLEHSAAFVPCPGGGASVTASAGAAR